MSRLVAASAPTVNRAPATVWLLMLAAVAVGACGTVEADPLAKDGAGGNGAADVGGRAGGAGGAAGEMGGAGEAGHADASGAAGTTAPSSAGSSGSAGAGGAGGAPPRLGVSDVACPYDWAVQRGCPGQNVSGSPCDVCHDAGGAALRCSTDPRAGARVYCVPDCSQCY